jgi:hypothetical protein
MRLRTTKRSVAMRMPTQTILTITPLFGVTTHSPTLLTIDRTLSPVDVHPTYGADRSRHTPNTKC